MPVSALFRSTRPLLLVLKGPALKLLYMRSASLAISAFKCVAMFMVGLNGPSKMEDGGQNPCSEIRWLLFLSLVRLGTTRERCEICWWRPREAFFFMKLAILLLEWSEVEKGLLVKFFVLFGITVHDVGEEKVAFD